MKPYRQQPMRVTLLSLAACLALTLFPPGASAETYQSSTGTRIQVTTITEGLEHPWSMAFYEGDRFPDWRDNLFVGSLKFHLLVRLQLDGNKVIEEERLLKDKLGRIRDVRTGPDGYLYLLTDEDNGKLVRLEPVQ